MAEQQDNDAGQILLDSLSPESIPEAEHPAGVEMYEYAFTNDKSNPLFLKLFHMLHNAAFANKLGVMHCKNTETDTIQTLIVGVDHTEDGITTWPLAKILTEEEQGIYLAPDGEGGYLGEAPAND